MDCIEGIDDSGRSDYFIIQQKKKVEGDTLE